MYFLNKLVKHAENSFTVKQCHSETLQIETMLLPC